MPDALIFAFDGIGAKEYWAVNEALGVKIETGEGWPPGLLYHVGAGKDGGWVVFEVWDSKESQERFMQGQLGRALEQGGVTVQPTRVEWLDVAVARSRA